MADEENPTRALGSPQTPSPTICGDTMTTGGVVFLPAPEADWGCPECGRVFHRSFAAPQCPICHVDMKREIIDNTAPPGERVKLVD